MVTHDYSFGTRSNVVDVNGFRLGLSICFDIVDDQQIYDMVSRGASVILAQTNNADFGYSAESVQQLAIAKMRALETGRSVVNISTVGVSSIMRPDGSVQSELPAHKRGAMTEDVLLSHTTTSAMVIGRSFELVVSLVGLVGVVLTVSSRKTRRPVLVESEDS
jgi:apolipoprotein N-acyltransferase